MYFQAVNMQGEIKNRGRAYRCNRCHKVLRKSRMEAHIMKVHVPMDQVPYYCALCSFRCTERQTLLDHLRSYRPHRQAEAKAEKPINYTDILRRSDNPYTIGETDMTVLSREESYRWHAGGLSLDDTPADPFAEEEDADITVRGGIAYPSWIFGTVTAPDVPAYEPTPLSQLQAAAQRLQAPTLGTPSGVMPMPTPPRPRLQTIPLMTTPTPSLRVQPATTVTTWSAPPMITTLNLQDCASTFPLTFPLPSSTATSVIENRPTTPVTNPRIPAANLTTLNTPVLHLTSPTSVQTPVQDENILPTIIQMDEQDPLLKESRDINRETLAKDGEPVPKKARKDNDTQLESLTAAITKGFEQVVEAINSNTRAIRCQDKNLERAVNEISRIERKLNLIERSLSTRGNGKENTQPTRPAVKSIIKRP